MAAKKSDNFFNSAKSWSRRKHNILSKYLMPFSAKVGSRSKEIFIVDGFAGAAKYDDEYEGSPLLIARVADECAKWQNPVALKVINVEAKPAHYKLLCEATKPWVDRGVVRNKKGRFGKLVSEIIGDIGEAPAFFFIDPYGPSPLHFSYLRPILERKQAITELIINFDADGLRRLADDLHANTTSEVGRKACKSIVTLVDNILGSDQWQRYFKAGRMKSYERELFLVDNYTQTLSRFGYKVVAYPIRESIRHHPKYWLIYCTRHNDGMFLMNGFIRREEDALLRESYEGGGQACMFDVVADAVNDRRHELRQLIESYVGYQKRVTRGSVKAHFIKERFAQYDEKDYNAVVQEMLASGILRSSHGKPRINDNEPLTYYPSCVPGVEQAAMAGIPKAPKVNFKN
jgi:three-Cys-motif partner protein